MRNMSFSMTRRQMVARTKTVTRRWGWRSLEVGDVVMAVRKAQGLKKGEKVEHIHPIRIVSVEYEPLVSIYLRDVDSELALEGFPGMNPRDFINLLLDRKHPNASYLINRIEFTHE